MLPTLLGGVLKKMVWVWLSHLSLISRNFLKIHHIQIPPKQQWVILHKCILLWLNSGNFFAENFSSLSCWFFSHVVCYLLHLWIFPCGRVNQTKSHCLVWEALSLSLTTWQRRNFKELWPSLCSPLREWKVPSFQLFVFWF